MNAFNNGQYIVPFNNVLYIKLWDTDIGFTINAINGDKIIMKDKNIEQIDSYTDWLKLKTHKIFGDTTLKHPRDFMPFGDDQC